MIQLDLDSIRGSGFRFEEIVPSLAAQPMAQVARFSGFTFAGPLHRIGINEVGGAQSSEQSQNQWSGAVVALHA